MGILSPNTHDWRLFVTPEELERALAQQFQLQEVIGIRPELGAVVSLVLWGLGLIEAEGLWGGFVVGGPPWVNYIGYATKLH